MMMRLIHRQLVRFERATVYGANSLRELAGASGCSRIRVGGEVMVPRIAAGLAP